MLKPSLQLKLGQQLTMTPQLQQAIRLLQLPALELQAHIRELLETNVMLEPMDEAESTGTFEALVTAAEQPKAPERTSENTVEVLELAGYAADEIKKMSVDGIVGAPNKDR